MLDIAVEINGRKVNPRNMKDAMESMVVSGIIDSIRDSVKNTHCPNHGQSPKPTVKGRNLSSLSVEVSGCCDELQELVQAKLK